MSPIFLCSNSRLLSIEVINGSPLTREMYHQVSKKLLASKKSIDILLCRLSIDSNLVLSFKGLVKCIANGAIDQGPIYTAHTLTLAGDLIVPTLEALANSGSQMCMVVSAGKEVYRSLNHLDLYGSSMELFSRMS